LAWCYADIWERIAASQPDAPALIQGAKEVAWGDFDACADSLAATLLDAGLTHQSKVACYLHNSPAYLIGCYGAFKAGLVPFNVNYRYGAEELLYLLENADAEAVIFDAEFGARLDNIRDLLPRVKLWIAVGSPVRPWAESWSGIVGRRVEGAVRGHWGRSGDDLLIIYTGGTTGRPKGVMWRQDDLWGATKFGALPSLGIPPLDAPENAAGRAATLGGPITLVGSPLMHATGLMSAFGALSNGGAAAMLPSRRFDAMELFDEAERLHAARISVVGMAFATPMLEVLDLYPGRWDLSALKSIGSSGAMWSYENKQGLLSHLPHLTLADSFASSEAFGMGMSSSTAGGETQTARFAVGEHCAVFTEDLRRVTPGSGERGRVAVGGHIPLGYYNDEEKTAKTFPVIDGKRWSMPGDWATVDADGTLSVLGRGNQCINTGGEKVFPEEVEEALKRHGAVRDAAVVGLPDPRFGETICALVEIKSGALRPEVDDLARFVRGQLADYKAPRRILFVPSIGRAPNGKLDYQALKERAGDMAA
jgi:3-oxocholest-4-en-26-oate---CoA ligase